jgi:hypothetical protein
MNRRPHQDSSVRASRRTRNPSFGGGQLTLNVKVSRSVRPSVPEATRL